MKFKRVVIVVIIVSVIHAGIWCLMLGGNRSEKKTAENPAPVETQPVAAPTTQEQPQNRIAEEPPPSIGIATPSGATRDPGAVATGAPAPRADAVAPSYSKMPVLSDYAPFVNDPGDLPPKLETMVRNECRSGILVDLTTRRILWQKNAGVAYSMASMSKIMTAYELVSELRSPECQVKLDTKVQVTRKMYKKFSDCHIYMDPHEQFTVDELLKCMMIHSANDCAYLVGEFMAGSEEAFVARMNARAQYLGFKSFNFVNTNGLPDRARKKANSGCAYEIARLAELVMDVPEIMKWASTARDSIREGAKRFDLVNKNHLLGSRSCPGITGLKTGYIDDSKFCITVTCERQGHRMVCVVMGVDKAKRRDQIVINLLNWGYTVK